MRTNSLRGQEEHSAITFRRLLDSLARPGKLNQLEYPTFLGDPPCYLSNATAIPLNFYALGALWTLLDREVSFVLAANGRWLDHNASTAQWLALRSGAGAAVPDAANFAFFCDGSSNGLLLELNRGSLLEPESSATAIYCVERLTMLGRFEETMTLELTGPGIQERRAVSVAGLDRGEIELIQATRRNYPLGIDIYLVDMVGQCVGLPRTTKIHPFQRHRDR